MAKLNEMIKDFRLSIDQSIEALALLMQMAPEEYARLEEDWNPPADVLQRLCALFEWASRHQPTGDEYSQVPNHN